MSSVVTNPLSATGGESDGARSSGTATDVVVAAFPYIRENPYQQLLYRELAGFGFAVDTASDFKLRQLVCESQTRGIAAALKWIGASPMQDGYPSRGPLEKILGSLDMTLDSEGLDALMFGKLDPFLVRPRAIEVGMAINRLASTLVRHFIPIV